MTEYESQAHKPFEHDFIIYSHRARERILYLESIPADLTRDLDESEEWELDTLRQLRDKAVALWGEKAWDDGLSFIADHYWEEWAADQAEGIYGEAAKTEFWRSELWSETEQAKFESVTYDETEYWGDGES